MAKDEEQVSVDEQKTEVLDPVEAEQTSEEPENVSEEQAVKEKKRFSRTTKIALVVAAIIAALLACVCIGYMFGSHETSNYIEDQETAEVAAPEEQTTTEESDAIDTNTAEEAHVHNWGPNYVLKHVDAVTHTVDHSAVWESQTSYHTVCNTCMQVIDGQAAQHIAQTGHQGYSTNVPITGDVKVSDAWTETVVDEEAHDELVVDGEICSECGATRNTSE